MRLTRSFAPALQGQLEKKDLMAAALITSATLVFINPTPGTDNTIQISRFDGPGTLASSFGKTLDININGVDNLFDANLSHMVWFDGGATLPTDHEVLFDTTKTTDEFVFAIGGAADNKFVGGAGMDCFLAGSGRNELDAGTGYSVLIGNAASTDTTINLSSTGSGFVMTNGAKVNHATPETGTWFIIPAAYHFS